MPEKKYAIVGLGVLPGPHPGRSPRAVQAESCWKAIEDAGLKREDIDGAIDGRTGGGSGDAASWTDPYPRIMGLPINFYYGVGRGRGPRHRHRGLLPRPRHREVRHSLDREPGTVAQVRPARGQPEGN